MVIPADRDSYLLKVRRVEAGRLPDRSLLSRVRLAPATLQIEDSALGRGQSTHLRVVAPAGTELDSVVVQSPEWLEPYRTRITPQRAMIHATADDFPVDRRFVLVSMWPTARGFLISSLGTCMAGLAVLLGLLHLERTEQGYVTEFASAHPDVVFAAMLALPSIYIMFLSRLNEHDLRSFMLQDLRHCLYAVGIVHTAAILALMTAGRFEFLLLPTWLLAICVSSCCALLLVASHSRSRTGHIAHEHVTFVTNAFTVQLQFDLDSEVPLY